MESFLDNMNGLVYYISGSEIKFLTLKKVLLNETVWQSACGSVENLDLPKDAAIRIVAEKTGLKKFLRVEDFESVFKGLGHLGQEIRERFFLFEIENKQEIVLSEDYVDYSWLFYAEFLHLLKRDLDKNVLAQSYWKILSRQKIPA